VPRAFALDLKELERRFYERSRALHPDRHTAAGPAARAASLERMSLLNQAYSALKDPRARREYLLELEGVKLPEESSPLQGQAQGQLPQELVEEWFELQEALMEGSPEARESLRRFRSELEAHQERLAAEIAELERRHDALAAGERSGDDAAPASQQVDTAPARRQALEELGRKLQAANYLRSLERNIARWVR
jgi:molecular chaperone HscB